MGEATQEIRHMGAGQLEPGGDGDGCVIRAERWEMVN